MDKRTNVQRDVTQLISEVLGDKTAKLYSNFYDQEDPKTIILAAKELLTEFLGENKTKEKIEPLAQKYDIKITYEASN